MEIDYLLQHCVELRTFCRKAVGASGSIPVILVDGNKSPCITGSGWHYRNKSGDRIYYPSAYRRAWGKPIYHASTLCVEVGRKWLIKVVRKGCVPNLFVGKMNISRDIDGAIKMKEVIFYHQKSLI